MRDLYTDAGLSLSHDDLQPHEDDSCYVPGLIPCEDPSPRLQGRHAFRDELFALWSAASDTDESRPPGISAEEFARLADSSKDILMGYGLEWQQGEDGQAATSSGTTQRRTKMGEWKKSGLMGLIESYDQKRDARVAYLESEVERLRRVESDSIGQLMSYVQTVDCMKLEYIHERRAPEAGVLDTPRDRDYRDRLDRDRRPMTTRGKETHEEFFAGYANRSGTTVAFLRRRGLVAEPCDCEEPECAGGWTSEQKPEAAVSDSADTPAVTG